eukprot:XP_020407634.1 uncharacterized protein LOC109945711 [Zea mays]
MRYAGAPRPCELKLRRAGAALRTGGTRQCGRDRAAMAASRGCGELAGGTVRARAAPGLRTHRRGRRPPRHGRPGRARRVPTGETGPRRATAPWPRAGEPRRAQAGERTAAGTGPRAGERDRRPWPGRAGRRGRAGARARGRGSPRRHGWPHRGEGRGSASGPRRDAATAGAERRRAGARGKR